MNGFRTLDPDVQANSDAFQSGLLDGLHDKRRLEHDPPLPVRGMDPQRSWSWLYREGYKKGLG